MAAFSGQQRAVEVLLAWGADGTAKDNVSIVVAQYLLLRVQFPTKTSWVHIV